MPDLIVKTFEDRQVRIQDKHGEFWFSGKDVCPVLGMINYKDALSRLPDDEKAKVGITDPSNGQQRWITIISEPGLYRLIFTSRKPEAERFKRWVFHEVLPSIRKTGKYEIAPPIKFIPI